MSWLESLDVTLFRFINLTLSNGLFDRVMPFFSGNSFFVPLLIVLAAVLGWREGVRGRVCLIMLVLVVCLGDPLIVNSLKHAAGRLRPFNDIPDAITRVGRGGSFSMPSAHSANWFSAATVLFLYYRRSAWVMLPFAVLVGFSRVYNGVHYPSDVLVGATLGASYAVVLIWSLDALWRWAGQRWFPLWWKELPSLGKPGSPLESPGGTSHQSSIVDRQSSIDQHWLRLGYVLIALLFLVRLAYLASGKIELSEDEAYQWLWSKHPALSYYSKPPLIAYAQFIGTHLWGDTEFGVRFFAPAITAMVSLVLLRFMAREAGPRVGVCLVLTATATPLLAVGSNLMTIDPLSVLFWTAAMTSGWRAVKLDSTRHWLWTGLWMGLGFLSKYTALLQWLCWLVFFALWHPARAQWKRPGPYLALLINALCALPVLIWNTQNGWITVTHLEERGGLDTQWHPTLRYLWDFVGAETALLNPIFFVATIWAAIAFWRHQPLRENPDTTTKSLLPLPVRNERGERRGEGHSRELASSPRPSPPLREERERTPSVPVVAVSRCAQPAYPLLVFLFSMGAPLFLVYLLFTFRSRVLPNWIAPSVAPLFCLAAIYWNARWREGARAVKRWWLAGLGAGLAAVVICHDTNLTGKIFGLTLPPNRDPLKRVRSHRATARVVDEARMKLLAEGKPVFIIGNHYGISSLITFYLPEAQAGVPDRPLVYFRSSHRPENQFYFWPGYQSRKGQNAIFVQETHTPQPPPHSIQKEFASVTDLGIHDIQYRERVFHQIQIFECRDLR